MEYFESFITNQFLFGGLIERFEKSYRLRNINKRELENKGII